MFDVAGDGTTAGSIALRHAPPGPRDALVVTRLRSAGFIPIGRTNMTEFAFSGLGINPHYDTPRNPYDRKTGRVPGGSSSGAVVSVTDGMALGALGTDTGGSCRIPAALCGTVGYKPTAKRIPTAGTMPLSQTLDSIGSMAPSVACCALLDAVLAGETPAALPDFPLDGLRLAVPQTMVLDDLDTDVSRAFAAALTALSCAGTSSKSPCANRRAGPGQRQGRLRGGRGICGAPTAHPGEGPGVRPVRAGAARARQGPGRCRLHRADVGARGDDPPLRPGDRAVRRPDDADHADRRAGAARLAAPEAARAANYMLLRNTGLANFFDRCSVSIPCHTAGDAPVGLMLVGATGGDRRLLAIAAAVEKQVAPALDGVAV